MGYNTSEKIAIISALKIEYRNEDSSIVTKKIKLNTEELGGDYWETIQDSGLNIGDSNGFSLDDHLYTGGGGAGGSSLYNVKKYNDNIKNWTNVQNLNTATKACRGIANEYGYIFGGIGVSSNNKLNTNQQYNQYTNSWLLKTNLTIANSSHMAEIYNDKGYIGLGNDATDETSDKLYGYDFDTDMWVSHASCNTGRNTPHSFTSGNFMYAVGGQTLTEVNQYNDTLDAWKIVRSHIGNRRNAAMGFWLNGKGYSINGIDSAVERDVQQYNEDIDDWIIKKDTINKRYQATRGIVNNNGFLSNGIDKHPTTFLSLAEKYRNTNPMFIQNIKTSRKEPKQVIVGTNVNGVPSSLPVELRSDGSNWVTSISNSVSITPAISANAQGLYSYDLKVGIPKFHTQGYWTEKTNSPNTVIQYYGYNLNGSGYLTGGYNSSTFDYNQEYIFLLDSWVSKQGIGVNRQSHSAFSLNGFGYTHGGASLSSNSRYDQDTNTWTLEQSLANTTTEAAGFTLNGYGYCCHRRDSTFFNDSYQYNDAADTWTSITGGSTRTSAAGFSLNGSGYVCLGRDNLSTFFDSSVKYNDASDSWTTIASQSLERKESVGYNTATKGYTVNGESEGGLTNQCNEYNDANDTWKTIDSVSTAKRSSAGFSNGSFIYNNHGYNTNYVTVNEMYHTSIDINELNVTLYTEE